MTKTTAADKKAKAKARYLANRDRLLSEYHARYADGGYERFRAQMQDPAFVAKRKANWAQYYARKKDALSTKKRMRVRYGLTHAEYLARVEAQRGQCASCGVVPPAWPDRKRLAVDHDHATGLVRELLCPGCNIGIGHLRDSPALLRKAAMYLERHQHEDDVSA